MVAVFTITSKNQVTDKHVKGKIYVYERVLYYNPKIKITSYHYKYIGRKDNGVTKKVRGILPRRSLIHGPFIPIMRIVNASGIDMDHIIARYKFRWRIETMFRAQDECRIKKKSRDLRVRYFLFAYEQLVESIWYPFYHVEESFKKYLMELSDACTTMVKNVKRKERNRRQS